MATFAWQRFLSRLSRYIIATGEFDEDLPQDVAASGWLGYPPATEAQIVAAEERLGMQLPPSYRAFLRVTNGWRMVTNFIHKLWSVQEVGLHYERHAEGVDAWLDADPGEGIADEDYLRYGENLRGQPFRSQYLKTAIEVSSWTDGIYLLNPQTINAEGEWEAWFFAPWACGAHRYPSFWKLMQAERSGLVRLQRYGRGRPTPKADPRLGLAATDLTGLVGALRRPEPLQRSLALWALAELRNKEAFRPVLEVFETDEEVDVRCDAARTLGELRDPRSVAPLLHCLGRLVRGKSKGDDGGLRHATHQGLFHLRKAAAPALLAELDGPDALLRAEVLDLLTNMPDVPGRVEHFARKLDDTDRRVRAAAVRALSSVQGGQQAMRTIKRMVRNDRSKEVRAAAREVLKDWSCDAEC